MAVDLTKVSELDVEPGTLPPTMAAWVIREERFGEPTDAFQLEEIDVPEPGAFEVIVPICTPLMSEFGFACTNAPKIESLLPTTAAAGSPARASLPNSLLV